MMKKAQRNCDATLDLLAANCGLEDTSDLFSIELETMLLELKEDFEDWNAHTPERFIFDLLVRRSQTAIVDYWETILEIIAANSDNEKDVELHMDMLALLEHLLNQKVLHSTLEFYSEIVLKMIIFPTLSWKSGSPSTKIRKAGLICLMKLVEQNLIPSSKLYANFKECTTKIKGCMDDDWCNDLRFAATIAMRNFLQYVTADV
jgi:hypothetical protein